MSVRSRLGTAQATEPSLLEALRRYAEQGPLAFAITRGATHTLAYANAAFYRLAGVAHPALGAPIATAFPATEARALSGILDRAFRERVELLDQRVERSSGSSGGDWQGSAWPVIGDDAQVEAIGIQIREAAPDETASDIQRQVAEQMLLAALRERGLAEDAEAARRGAAFLAEASRLLAESVDQTSTLLALTKLALPTLGAWCIVDVLEDGGAIRRLAIYHPDAKKQQLALELEAGWIPEPDDLFGAPAMLRDTRPIVISENIEGTLVATAHGADNLRILRQLGIGSLLTVPLVARGKLLGAITFVGAEQHTYSAEDVQLAEAVAGRGALALDSAQMYDLALVLKRSAESANRAKTAFLGAMSHELRTPLNAIGGYIQLLDLGLRGPVTADQRAAFARVKTNQEHLTLLITEILNFVRLGSGRVAFAISDVPACEAMQHAKELVEPLFGQKGILFDGNSGDSTVVAHADPERMAQILVNLFSNAIKFTPAGGHVSTECSEVDGTVLLRVIDTGIGIAADKLEAIFEPFVQLKDGLSDRESGVGLGLAISRDLARAMKGDLTVKSTEGKGARFTLSLPRATKDSAGASQATARPAHEQAATKLP